MDTEPRQRAVVSLDEKSYVDTVWYVGWGQGDWMCTLYRDDVDTPWRISYRFRYYADDKAFESEDRKSVSGLTAPDNSEHSRAEAYAACCMVQRLVAADHGQSESFEVPIRGGRDTFVEATKKFPWMHLRSLSTEAAYRRFRTP